MHQRLAFSLDGLRVLQDVTDTLKKGREGRGARRWCTGALLAFRMLASQLDVWRVLQDVTDMLKKDQECRGVRSVRLQAACLHRRLANQPDSWLMLQDVTDTLKKDREGRGARRWRTAFRRIQQQLLDLETDSRALELVYPQVGSLPVFGSD